MIWTAILRNSGDWPVSVSQIHYIAAREEESPISSPTSVLSIYTLRSSVIRKKHGHVGALPDQSTECLRWCQNLPGLKSPITDDGLKPTKWWKSTYGTITFIYLYKILTACLCINVNENILKNIFDLLQFKRTNKIKSIVIMWLKKLKKTIL